MLKVFLGIKLLVFSLNLQANELKRNIIVVENINIISVIDKGIFQNKNVLIENGIITLISDYKINIKGEGLQFVDGKGKYLVPGFIDSHMHMINTSRTGQRDPKFVADEFKMMLFNGVTSFRNLKSFTEQIELANRIDTGEVFAPRMYVTSPALDTRIKESYPKNVNYYCRDNWSNCTIYNLKGAEEIVKKFDKDGYDAIKVREPLSEEILRAVIVEAKALGLPIVGHVADENYGMYPEIYTDNLYQSIEHSYGLYEFSESESSPFYGMAEDNEPPDLLRSFYVDDSKLESIVSIAADNFKGYRVPTLQVHKNLMVTGSQKILAEDYMPGAEYLDKCWLKEQQAGSEYVYGIPKYEKYRNYRGEDTYINVYKNVLKLMKKLHDAGIKFAVGTDAPAFLMTPGFSYHDELQQFADAGFSNYEILKAATLNGAQLMGEEKLGYIAVGAIADLVLLDANPLESISNTRKINAVIKDGVLIDNKEINNGLKDLKARAQSYVCDEAGSTEGVGVHIAH